MSTLIRRSIAFTAPQSEHLEAEAAALGISVAELVRRIVDAHRLAVSDAPVSTTRLPREAFE